MEGVSLTCRRLQSNIIKGENKVTIQDAQGNTIYPCGYVGGAKVRVSAEPSFEPSQVSLSSSEGITQIEKDREAQVLFKL